MRPNPRTLGAAFAVSLATLLWAASTASPPLLSVSEVSSAGDGTVVRVFGVVADIRVYDSGYASVLLADHITGATIHVILPPSRSDAVLGAMAIGDQVFAEGTTSIDSTGATVFADCGSVEIMSRAAFTMSVEFLCSHWRLFEFDRFNVTGSVTFEGDECYWWLSDPASGHRIRAMPCDALRDTANGATVLVDCTLLVDLRTMTICLRTWAVAPFES
jgi:hypothetical protein